MSWLSRFRPWLAIVLLAVWWGGFTFYALVVVPTGHKVLKSKVHQGFITQQVTDRLNVLAAATGRAALATDGFDSRSHLPTRRHAQMLARMDSVDDEPLPGHADEI